MCKKLSLQGILMILGFSAVLISCIKEEAETTASPTTSATAATATTTTTSTTSTTTTGTTSGTTSSTTTNTLVTTNLGSSHNTGKNCLNCHSFPVGGSVYKKDLVSTYPGTVVKLTTMANGAGTVVATLTTDNSGNIHTSSSVNFGTGLYASVMGATSTKYMASAIKSGACNSCHGSSTSKVWTE